MKKYLIILALISATSCTKTPPTGNANNTTGYDCFCWWITPAGVDSQTHTALPSSDGLQGATDICKQKDIIVKSISGSNSGAFCRIY